MRAQLLATIGCLTLIAGRAPGQEQEIEVGLANNTIVLPIGVLVEAENTATRIYAGIGVKLKWSNNRKAKIRMQIDNHTPATVHPGAMGYALPYGGRGAGIHILLDRISERLSTNRHSTAILLGHVMAHELGHLLEGFSHHAEPGLMKAHWDEGESLRMRSQPLSFSSDDVAFIRNGVARWLR
ncbi:MAG: hypothetical protein QOJ99_603 [Bryobacterales bacterium]|jgi:hypothetical protein|nr:hypothetical protein [Bryobacterales bacterium]